MPNNSKQLLSIVAIWESVRNHLFSTENDQVRVWKNSAGLIKGKKWSRCLPYSAAAASEPCRRSQKELFKIITIKSYVSAIEKPKVCVWEPAQETSLIKWTGEKSTCTWYRTGCRPRPAEGTWRVKERLRKERGIEEASSRGRSPRRLRLWRLTT